MIKIKFQDIQNLLKNYKSQFNLSSLKLQNNSRRGYFFSIEKSFSGKLPSIFIQIQKQGKKITFTSEELIKLNQVNNFFFF